MKPHDITLTPAALYTYFRERNRVEDSVERFARDFAEKCGERVPDEWYFTGFEQYAGRIHAKFEVSDQCGGSNRTIKFTTLCLSDAAEANAAVAGRRADIETEAHEKKMADEARTRLEIARLTAKLPA